MSRWLRLMFDDNAFAVPDSFEEDEIDIFAELGVTGVRPANTLAVQKQIQNENLAILLGNDEEDDNQIIDPLNRIVTLFSLSKRPKSVCLMKE